MIALLAATVLFQTQNALTPAEVKAGWQLLFDGKTTKGWHNFKSKGVKPGWTIKDGVLTSSDPGNAGDIVTDEQFTWFELQLDYKNTVGGNSGILFRVVDGEETWHSGPEVQIYDYQGASGAQKTGWLYELYPGEKETTNPPGQWDHLRLLVSPEKCQTDINGAKYYEFVIDSKDWWDRVAKSKFSEHPEFAKSKTGSIGIQGDHGVVSFRNIKIRKIKAK